MSVSEGQLCWASFASSGSRPHFISFVTLAFDCTDKRIVIMMMITVWSVFPSAALLIVCSTLDAIFVSLLPYDLQRSFDGDFFCSTYHLAIRCDH